MMRRLRREFAYAAACFSALAILHVLSTCRVDNASVKFVRDRHGDTEIPSAFPVALLFLEFEDWRNNLQQTIFHSLDLWPAAHVIH